MQSDGGSEESQSAVGTISAACVNVIFSTFGMFDQKELHTQFSSESKYSWCVLRSRAVWGRCDRFPGCHQGRFLRLQRARHVIGVQLAVITCLSWSFVPCGHVSIGHAFSKRQTDPGPPSMRRTTLSMTALLILYLITTSVMLLNLLIAAFSDTYSRLTNEAESELGHAFSRVCLEYYRRTYMLPSPLNIPQFLCMMVHRAVKSCTNAGSTAVHRSSSMLSRMSFRHSTNKVANAPDESRPNGLDTRVPEGAGDVVELKTLKGATSKITQVRGALTEQISAVSRPRKSRCIVPLGCSFIASGPSAGPR